MYLTMIRDCLMDVHANFRRSAYQETVLNTGSVLGLQRGTVALGMKSVI